jgi:hypothetical protein
MASIRISGNWRNPNKREWGGICPVDDAGRIERALDIPGEVYEAIERAIAGGGREGTFFREGDIRFDWLLD